MWITESVGGVGENGVPLVTRSSFRFLNTLYTLGPAPEPNLTVLWSERLPEGFKPVSYTHLDVYKRQPSILGVLFAK